MLKLRKIVITGVPGSGKSLACSYFKELGAYVVDADKITHQLLSKDITLINEIRKIFGNKVFENEKINREKLADIVFNDFQKLKLLEKLIHPKIFQKIVEKYEKVKKLNKYKLFIIEIALFFESKYFDKYFFDFFIEILSNKCFERLEQKHVDLDNYKKRMENHFSQEEKAKKANLVITNNGTSLELLEKIKQFISNQ